MLGVSVVEYMVCESPSPFTSPSANCRNAEPTPLREITYRACDAAKLWRDVTVCFMSRFRCLHLATPSSLSTLEFEHPIVFVYSYLSEGNSTFITLQLPRWVTRISSLIICHACLENQRALHITAQPDTG